jgi:hypothetical protein
MCIQQCCLSNLLRKDILCKTLNELILCSRPLHYRISYGASINIFVASHITPAWRLSTSCIRKFVTDLLVQSKQLLFIYQIFSSSYFVYMQHLFPRDKVEIASELTSKRHVVASVTTAHLWTFKLLRAWIDVLIGLNSVQLETQGLFMIFFSVKMYNAGLPLANLTPSVRANCMLGVGNAWCYCREMLLPEMLLLCALTDTLF